MKYVGLYTQQRRNNRMSILLLFMFPIIILFMIWVFLAVISFITSTGETDIYGNPTAGIDLASVTRTFVSTIPWVIGGVAIWFIIAYKANTAMVRAATGARPLTRKENPRVYNIVENLTMSCGMDMPKLNIIDDPQLNAFASGIDRDSYTVTVTTGLLRILNDDELAGVIAHELTHIRNRDTRLLITSIIFVGIISTVMGIVYDIFMRMLLFGGGTRNDSDEDNRSGVSTLVVMVVAMICSAIAYLFIILTRFAISRKREFMADAGGAEICGNPLALASALRKISAAPGLGGTEREDIAQLFIVHPKMSLTGLSQFVSRLFATHPDTAERIRLLEQF